MMDDKLELKQQDNLTNNIESSSNASLKKQPGNTDDHDSKKGHKAGYSSGKVHPHPPVPSERKSSSSSSSRSSQSTKKEGAKRFSQRVKEAHRKMKLRGIEEIDEEHRLYPIATAIRRGLEDSQKSYPKPVCFSDLGQDAYSRVETFAVANDNSNKTVEFRSYAPEVFESLRNVLEIDSHQDYYNPLHRVPYLEYKSNSRNGQIFFLCNDKRYFLKTENAKDVQLLLEILPQYISHLSTYPHSLIVRILGLHYIKLPGKKGKFFSVMQSVFHPEERIYARYDLKGCIANRFIKQEKAGSDYVTVLKDVNFGDQQLSLRDQKEWFLKQVAIDVAFLQGFNIMDYSMMVGQQTLHSTELQGTRNLAEIVQRASKSVPRRMTQTKEDVARDKEAALVRIASRTGQNQEGSDRPVMTENDQRLSMNDDPVSTNNPEGPFGSVEAGAASMGQNHEREDEVDMDALFKEHNLRLLPNIANGIHAIDGREGRYFVGIIDILGQYTMKKKLETMLKTCMFPRTPFSAVNSRKYAKRFQEHLAKHID